MERFVILFFAILFLGCVYDPPKKIKRFKFKIINETNNTFYVYTNCSDSIKMMLRLKYPFYETKNGKMVVIGEKIINGYKVKANSKNDSIYIDDYSLKSFFKNCKEKRLNVFLIEENVLKNYSWQEIYEKQMYKRRISLKEDYFKNRNYILINKDEN